MEVVRGGRPTDSEPPGGFPAWPALALICAAGVLVLSILGTRLTFFNDDWAFLLQRPGLEGGSILSPHNGQLVVGVDLTFKVLVALFGYGQLPFRLVLGATVAALGVVTYLLVSDRAGKLAGLAAATIVVFLGPAWEDLLFFASIGPVVALLCGLSALLFLEKDSARRNGAACVLLVTAVCFSGVGLAFLIAAGVAVLIRGPARQLWIPAIPALVYVLWVLGWGDHRTAVISTHNVAQLPRYVLQSASIGLASVTGLNRGAHPYVYGYVLLGIAVAVLAVWLFRGGRPSRWLAVFATAALAFWVLTGLSFVSGREPSASRYQLMDAVLLLAIAAELLRPVRLRVWQNAVVVLVAALVLVSNLDRLDQGYRFLKGQSAYAKADLGVMEIARGRARSDVRLTQTISRNPYLSAVTSDRYYQRTREHGSIAHLSPQQIASSTPALQESADSVLGAVYAMRLGIAGPPAADAACRRIPPQPAPLREVEVSPGEVLVQNTGKRPLVIFLGRFSPPGKPVPVGFSPPGSASVLAVPADSVPVRWRVSAQGGSGLQICPTAPASRAP